MVGEGFPDSGKRFQGSESVAHFATERVIAHISENLSFRRISSKFRRIVRLGRKTFPSARETLHMAVVRFPDFVERFPISGNAAGFSTRRVISDIPTNLSF